MTKTLELKFSTSTGKTKTMSVKDPILNLSPEITQQAMDKIINLNIFEVDGVNPYAGRLSARYVERILTDIFETK